MQNQFESRPLVRCEGDTGSTSSWPIRYHLGCAEAGASGTRGPRVVRRRYPGEGARVCGWVPKAKALGQPTRRRDMLATCLAAIIARTRNASATLSSVAVCRKQNPSRRASDPPTDCWRTGRFGRRSATMNVAHWPLARVCQCAPVPPPAFDIGLGNSF